MKQSGSYISSDDYQFDVFISYSSESSKSFVVQLANWFEQDNGIKCWYAPRDLDITAAGKDYDDELVLAVRNARCMVVVLNDDALQSKWVKHEVNFAEKQGKVIIPFAISELTIENSGLRMRLDDLHIITAYPNPKEKFPILLSNVKRILGNGNERSLHTEIKHISSSDNEIDLDYNDGMALMEAKQDKEAFLAFFRSAKNGNKASSYKLIEIIQRNQRSQFLDDQTWKQIKQLADNGEGYAELLMHYRYFASGIDNKAAIEYLKRAINHYDSSFAYLQLGVCYRWGMGVPQNDVLAKKYYDIALEKGSSLACRYLGQMYLYGGNCIKKDHEKAEAYLKQGVEMGEERCLKFLFQLYAITGTYEKAHEIAQKMIDNHVQGGYTLMGDYFRFCNQNLKEAEEWYVEAGKHEENGVWGTLADICWHNEKKEEAFRYAQKGYSVNDSFSYKMLGYICSENGDYENAWNYYYQAVRKFGTGYDGLARLYLYKNYHPDNYSLSNLKYDLELSVKLQDAESVKYLLEVMLMEKGKDYTTVNYENLKDLPDAYVILRMGANAGDKECLYMYGRLLMECTGEMYNPFRGIDLIESAVEKGHTDAIIYALKYYEDKSPQKILELSNKVVNSRSFVGPHTLYLAECFLKESKPTLVFVDWLYLSMRILVWEDTYMFFDCLKIFRNSVDALQGNVKDWLDTKLDEFYGQEQETLFLPFYACLLGQKLSIDKQNIDNMVLTYVRNFIDVEYDLLHMSKISYFKGGEKLIWPDYSAENILNGDFSNERDLRILYGVTDNSLPDALEIYSESGASEISRYFSTITYTKGLSTTKTEVFFSSYAELIESYLILVQKGFAQDLQESLSLHSPSVSCSIEDALEYSLKAFKMLIASRNAFGTKWNEVVENLSNMNRFLEIADAFSDKDIKNLLSRYYSLIIARNELILFDIHFEHANLKEVAETINAVISELNERNILHEFKPVTEENLPPDLVEWRMAMSEYVSAIKSYIINSVI